MEEYVHLGHITEFKIKSYFIPHHAVHEPEKTSTPLHKVFNASSNTFSGYSVKQWNN